MSLTNFNNIKAAEVQVVLENIWANPSTYKSFMPSANALKAILENQTAVLSVLETPDKLRELAVKWVDFCGDTSSDGDYDDSCTNQVAGEGEAKTESYALDLFPSDSYSVAIEELESAVVDYDTIVATGLAAKIKNIIERFNNAIIAAIAANKGVNPFPDDYTFDAAAKDTTIPGADYGVTALYPYFMQVASLNKSQNVYLLDGGRLFKDYYIAQKSRDNADGKTESNMYADIPFRHDMPGFASNSLTNSTFLIDRGSLAVANRAKFPSLQSLSNAQDGGWIKTTSGSFMRYSIPINMSDLLPMTFIQQGQLIKQQLMVDVQYGVICDTADNNKLKATWSLKLRGGIFNNPIRCNAGNTGILSFVKGAA